MTFQFLGTSAGEQYPGFWCACEYCAKARRLGGKNIRKNSCAIIHPSVLIDFPAEIFMQAERFGVSMLDVEYLLITHPHEDHWQPWPLFWRHPIPVRKGRSVKETMVEMGGPRFTPLKTLHIIGNKRVLEMVRELFAKINLPVKAADIELHEVAPFQACRLGKLDLMPLKANHLKKAAEPALNYIIKTDGRTILYALDTGWFFPETYEKIRQYQYDLVVIEGTFGNGVDSEEHFNFPKLEKARALFAKDGLLKPGAKFCTSHICPHATPVHDKIAPVLSRKGIVLAHDGMKIQL